MPHPPLFAASLGWAPWLAIHRSCGCVRIWTDSPTAVLGPKYCETARYSPRKSLSSWLANPRKNSRAMSAMSMSVGRGGTKKRAFVPHGVVAPASFPRTGRFAEQMISDDERSQLEELARSLDFGGDDHGAGQPQQSNTVRAAAGCISSQTWGYTMRTIVDPSPEHINQRTHPFFSTHTNTHETRLVASFRSAYRRPPAGLSGTMNRRPLGGRISRVSRRNSSTFSRCGPRPNRWLRSLARL